ncbi:hypothetical protein F750_1200 [Streptomyces sp. PAMC 26508]|nr:hypothetical protein F750_1200 [Streptomyces sp. PAMC 26508]
MGSEKPHIENVRPVRPLGQAELRFVRVLFPSVETVPFRLHRP